MDIRGVVLPSYRLLEMCFLIGLYFHDSTDYNGVTFSDVVNRVTKMGSHFWDFGGAQEWLFK